MAAVAGAALCGGRRVPGDPPRHPGGPALGRKPVQHVHGQAGGAALRRAAPGRRAGSARLAARKPEAGASGAAGRGAAPEAGITADPPRAAGPRVALPPPRAAEQPPQNEPALAPEPPREATPPSPAPPWVAAVPESAPAPDIRKALRRGGPGPTGAGGRGEGWSGIEGEPIPLDSTDPKFNDYLDRIRRMIKEKWGYPCIKDTTTGHCDYKSARLVVVFGILKDGRVPMLEVALQSGYEIYDDYAVNAIKLASPFPPVPASLLAAAKSGSAGVKIQAAFQYVLVESSLTNILR